MKNLGRTRRHAGGPVDRAAAALAARGAPATTLGALQQKHFRSMNPDELRQCRADTERELGMVTALPESPARDKKLLEPEARVEFMMALRRGKQ